MDKHTPFYGTPLSKSLKDDYADTETSIKNRKARLDHQQTVCDSEGRQRFHGAFTGGFSAGYFNTVGTKEGFRPKEFVSHRSSRHGAQKITHRPEDYMDEEDFGEFGIAPRKVRVNNQYSNQEVSCSKSSEQSFVNSLRPKTESIGDKILKFWSTNNSSRSLHQTCEIYAPPQAKNNYHGLGYQPLRKSDWSQSGASNPLIAVIGQGKRIKISGEAFGSGVLEDEDDTFNNANETYGFDDIKNYKFDSIGPAQHPKTVRPLEDRSDDYGSDSGLLSGFLLAKDLDTMNISDIAARYPPPRIPGHWVVPTRSEPYIPPKKEAPEQKLFLQRLTTGVSLGDKFTNELKPSSSTGMDSKAGLLHYSDIKATRQVSEVEDHPETLVAQTPTITRQVLEWRPCSLLCKRFNVPNPFPDNQFVGVKSTDSINRVDGLRDSSVAQESSYTTAAPMELRRSIFNVISDDNAVTVSDPVRLEESSDSENEPQIVVLSDSRPETTRAQDPNEFYESDHDLSDADVEVISSAPREPEIICLSSSSSSKASEAEPEELLGRAQQVEEDPDAYGPPLPPSLKTLMTSESGHSSMKRSKVKKKKKKKHKKHDR